jgi:uncharacterized membrane protein
VVGGRGPAQRAGSLARARGVLLIFLLIASILLAAFGIVSGLGAAAGGLSFDLRIFWSLVLIVALLAGLFLFGRRRQRTMEAKRAEQMAQMRGR